MIRFIFCKNNFIDIFVSFNVMCVFKTDVGVHYPICLLHMQLNI